MRKVALLIAVLTVSAFVLNSCKKEGCTNGFAINYDEDAEKDNGSCVYQGRVVVWFTSVTATDLVNASVPSVDIVINGVDEGSVGMTQFSVDEPECGNGEGFLAVIDMDVLGIKTFPYVIYKSGTTDVIQSGTVGVTANNCQWIQLVY